MRRGYVEAHVGLREAFAVARRWIGDSPAMVLGPSTSALAASSWLESTGLPLGVTGHRHSRFVARPAGVVIAWWLNLSEILDAECNSRVTGVVAVRAYANHAPWVTAHDVTWLGGEGIERVPEASAAATRTVEGLSMLAVLNQGMADSRERSVVVQALTYLHQRGHALNPEQLIVEALRNNWPREAPLELAQLATDLNAGKRLRFSTRLAPDVLADWAPDRERDRTGAARSHS